MSPRKNSPNRNLSRPGARSWRLRIGNLTLWQKLALGGGVLCALVCALVFAYFYVHFSRMIDARLSGEVFSRASLVYAAPTQVEVGERITPEDVAAKLQRAGYTTGGSDSKFGTYEEEQDRLVIEPGPNSFFRGPVMQEGSATLVFKGGRVASITPLQEGAPLQNYFLEPQVITTLFGNTRAKRRVVNYQQLPKNLVHAVVAAEDHTFFTHYGINLFRIFAAALADLRAGKAVEGGSTLTMQLARNFFLTPRRTISRKLQEIFIAFLLEHRLSKDRIFDLYANEIYLGQSGSFSIYGFGEAANAYFNKNVSSLTLPEAALLAGIIRGPNYYSPYRHAKRATERRNHVLQEMAGAGYISKAEAREASAAPLGLAPESLGGGVAPYFVDMIQDDLLSHFSEQQLLSQSYRIYTTIDPDLQRAASEAVATGMEEVDKTIAKMRHHVPQAPNGPREPQVAMVVLDPHTGAIRALVGGRNYAQSQLNHVLARRQPGSSFKPFVYAAALNSAIDGAQPVITPATILTDEPTTFQFGNQVYEPKNYKGEYLGPVSVREALAHSLNVATVELAQMVGFDKIRDLALAAGLNQGIQATPAIALGAYEVTPLELAGSYTIFSNSGTYEQPQSILMVNNSDGQTIYRVPQVTRQVLDPRISYLMVSLMQSVISEGTGASVRARGFTLPAAGKTGTSNSFHDGWFAGFTSNLLAVVWVGYDNDQALDLSGARSALPTWTAFMKHATALPDYSDVQPFMEPPGIVSVPLNEQGQLVASNSTENVHNEFFIQGTEPHTENPLERVGGILGRIFHPDSKSADQNAQSVISGPAMPAAQPPGQQNQGSQGDNSNQSNHQTQKKGGLLHRFLSIFKDKDSKPQSKQPSPSQPQP
ncbi:MAG TPA: PBP1A family penicillin-binding protein [Terriglobia bacterium]|nr:PBP1A family penicillin-binding protein [Terriglobia bacterium]